MAKKLLDLVRETIRLKHLSHRTEESYVQWIKRFVLFHNDATRWKWEKMRFGNSLPLL
jgi:hypothetical protein